MTSPKQIHKHLCKYDCENRNQKRGNSLFTDEMTFRCHLVETRTLYVNTMTPKYLKNQAHGSLMRTQMCSTENAFLARLKFYTWLNKTWMRSENTFRRKENLNFVVDSVISLRYDGLPSWCTMAIPTKINYAAAQFVVTNIDGPLV